LIHDGPQNCKDPLTHPPTPERNPDPPSPRPPHSSDNAVAFTPGWPGAGEMPGYESSPHREPLTDLVRCPKEGSSAAKLHAEEIT
jgi:hypothetical protein